MQEAILQMSPSFDSLLRQDRFSCCTGYNAGKKELAGISLSFLSGRATLILLGPWGQVQMLCISIITDNIHLEDGP